MIALRQPSFWAQGAKRPFYWPLLWLLSLVYGALVSLRNARADAVPLAMHSICVGNATAGGAGKTPTLLALAELLGPDKVVFLTRGFGGTEKGPLLVKPHHTAAQIGDEALLLARVAPTFVARDRTLVALDAANLYPGRVLLLDDGLQNPTFRATVNLLVWDGFGAGNGHILPAGPLRQPLDRTLAKVDAVITLDNAQSPLEPSFAATGSIPHAADRQPVVAFAGIGRPSKFEASLLDGGYNLQCFYPFADHHPYSEGELDALVAHDVPLLTTEKDWVRLPEAARVMVRPVPYRIHFANPAALAAALWEHLT